MPILLFRQRSFLEGPLSVIAEGPEFAGSMFAGSKFAGSEFAGLKFAGSELAYSMFAGLKFAGSMFAEDVRRLTRLNPSPQ